VNDPQPPVIRAVWPDPGSDPVTEAGLIERYAVADRSRPWLRLNFVTSVDGAVTLDGYSEGLSGVADKQVFGMLRMVCDALLVGAGTLRNEGYGAIRLTAERQAWRAAHGLAEHPTLVVVSSRLDLDPASPMFTEAPVRPVVLTHGAAPPDRAAALRPVADVLVHGDVEVDLRAGLAALHARGLRQILSEGGPHVLGTLTAQDLVDEVCLTISPLLVGPGPGRITAGLPAPAARRLELTQILAAEDALLLRYLRVGA